MLYYSRSSIPESITERFPHCDSKQTTALQIFLIDLLCRRCCPFMLDNGPMGITSSTLLRHGLPSSYYSIPLMHKMQSVGMPGHIHCCPLRSFLMMPRNEYAELTKNRWQRFAVFCVSCAPSFCSFFVQPTYHPLRQWSGRVDKS